MSRQSWVATSGSGAVLLIRLLAGSVFLSEGVQKFLFPEALGSGRFAAIGIPWPEVTGPLVGVLEVVGGALLLAGWLTRLAALLLVLEMVVAVASTKIPILLGHGYWLFAAPKGNTGFWAFAHESRTDFAMLLGTAFLLIEGAGRWSLDARIVRGAE